MLSQFCVRSENEKQQTEKTERTMLSQFCVRSENEKKQQTEKTERTMLSQFVFVLKMKNNKLSTPRGPCCRSLCSFRTRETTNCEDRESHAVAVLCAFCK